MLWLRVVSIKNYFIGYIFIIRIALIIRQRMVDGSASKPALKQDTGYIVEKTYLDIAPYLGAFGAYLMPQ